MMMGIATVVLSFILMTAKSIRLHKRERVDPSQSNEAIQRLIERIESIKSNTSCKVAAKFMLLTLGNIEHKSEMKGYKPTDNTEKNLTAMRLLLSKGLMLHIEIKPNHHFIVFLKTDKQVILLHAFQDRWTLLNWLSHQEVADAYLTVDAFFHYMAIMLNEQTDRLKRDEAILNLFMPDFFNKDPQARKGLLEYFRDRVKLVKVYSAPFNFSNKSKWKAFEALNSKVMKSYSFSDKRIE